MSEETIDGLVVDTSAWIEIFRGSEIGEKATEMIKVSNKIITPAIVLGEMRKKYIEMEYDNKKFYDDLSSIKLISEIIDIDEKNSIRAGEIRAAIDKKQISLIDCVLLSIAIEMNYIVISKDEHFKGVQNGLCLSNNEGN